MSSNDQIAARHKYRTINKCIWGLISLLILFTPLIVTFFSKGENLETRSGLVFPRTTWSFDYFTRLSEYLGENATLKNQAIAVDGFIDKRIFQEIPAAGSISPRVIEGRGGHAFLVDAFNEACNPHIGTNSIIEQMRLLAGVVEESGREFRLVVSPDKSTILTEFLPLEFPLQDCFEVHNKEFWERFSASGILGFVDLRTELLSARISRREFLYKSRDTHWDQAGGSVAAQAVVNSFGDNIWEKDNLQFTGLTTEVGDLDVLQGNSKLDMVPTYYFERKDVIQNATDTTDIGLPQTTQRFRHKSEKAYLIPGRTVIFGDSFSEAALPFYTPYFEDITHIRLAEFSQEVFLRAIANAKSVIFWSVERSFPYRVAYDWGTSSFITNLSRFLKQ
jgi:alginate O-acetyltransferase complex protein AlgJ